MAIDPRFHGLKKRTQPQGPITDPRHRTQCSGLPPDLVVHGVAEAAAEYWHLPSSVWDSINQRATGKGVVIANLDTGYNPDHDLIPDPIATRSFVSSERTIEDGHGHGSHTIGTNCGKSPLISPAFEASLIVGKVLSRNGSGASDGIAQAIRWAVSEGANIISMSLGGSQPYGPTRDAIQHANEAGVVVVAAAGNDGDRQQNTINWPGRFVESICVGAYREDGSIASFSSAGPEMDLATPGQNIVSCSHRGSSELVRMSGTSMATPYAAALFALILELVKREGGAMPSGPSWWREFLAKNSEDRGTPGPDDQFGVGVPLYMDIVRVLSNEDLSWV